jgi:hypothetical protein
MDFTHVRGRARKDIPPPLCVHPAKTNILNTVEYLKYAFHTNQQENTFAYISETMKEYRSILSSVM